tara:strand:+ start:2335 stop:2568 length:234 start_codon:yes stop_codon:yes gene_type:complete
MKKNKLIWVFSGPKAEELAKEKLTLLDDFGEEEELDYYSGTEYISHISWLTYFIVSEEEQAKYLSAFTPSRVEDFED